MKIKPIILCFLISNLAMAQQWDSLNFALRSDTLVQNSIHKIDSITQSFQSKADSLNAYYQNQFTKIDSVRDQIQSKIDNLTNLKLPKDKLTKKLDSLNQVMTEKVSALTTKVDDLKAKTTKELKEIQLPPELQEPMKKLQSSIDGYKLPSLNTTSLGLSSKKLPGFENSQLSNLSKQLKLYDNFGNISENLGDLKEVAGKAGSYTQDAQTIVKGNINEVKNIDKTLESKVADVGGVHQLTEGNALLDKTTSMDSAAMMDKAQEIAKEQIMNAAQDHFAGKEALLQEAMDKMTKLKTRYSEVQDIAALPKRLPNPLKGKPLIERLVPSIGFQIQKSASFLLDVSPLILYKITPRISAGAGWNHRFAIADGQLHQNESIYGPRAALEAKLPKGFNVRLLPEIMNTTIPPLIAQSKGVDAACREWIPSVFMGMKKDFKVYKQLTGYSEILYNLYDKDGMSPYGDKLSVRFGFEFSLKKKMRQ